MNRDWMVDAACRGQDPEVWFHISVGRARGEVADMRTDSDEAKAKAVCARCPVLETCLRDAMEMETQTYRWGIWGGLNPAERRALADGTTLPESRVRPLAETTVTFDDCGTYAACMRHRAHGQVPCKACQDAKRDYQRSYYRRRRDSGGALTTPPECGTRTAYRHHLKAGETPCTACRAANADAAAQRRANLTQEKAS